MRSIRERILKEAAGSPGPPPPVVAVRSIRERILKGKMATLRSAPRRCCSEVDPGEDTESRTPGRIRALGAGVAVRSIRERILKGRKTTTPPAGQGGCSEVDPGEDTESLTISSAWRQARWLQ